jgi:branched-subunit amino acid ABC-type transport system permease component
LVDVALIAYYGSFRGAFLLDDVAHIVEDPVIRDLSSAWARSRGTSRPLLTLSLAGNYAIGGLEVRGYHIFNFVVHVIAGLALFGVVRRTLIGMNRATGSNAGPGTGTTE